MGIRFQFYIKFLTNLDSKLLQTYAGDSVVIFSGAMKPVVTFFSGQPMPRQYCVHV